MNPSLIVTPNAYKAGKLYSVVPSDGTGDFTVTRATSATRINSLGLIETVGINIPRLDYTNASCPSILVEPQRTNLLLQSEQFQSTSFGGSWGVGSIQQTLLNIATSPSGLLDADKIFPIATLGSHFIFQLITTNKTVTQTASCFFKASNYTRCGIRFNDNSTNQGHIFDLISGQIIANFGTKTTAKITNYGNGWYRCEITITAPTDLLNIQFAIVDNTSTNFDFTGDNTKGLFFWGAQLELGGNATSYIPTTTAAVTRNADVLKINNNIDLIGQTEGSIYCEIDNIAFNQNSAIFVLQNNADQFNNRIGFRYTSSPVGVLNAFIKTGTNFVVSLDGEVNIVGKKYKMCFTYNQTEQKFFINGVLVSSRTGSYTQPNTLEQVQLGNMALNSFPSVVEINSVVIFKTILTNAQAIQLTTL